jgi:hypothetical protein
VSNARYQGSDQATPCSQSQIGQDCHLRLERTAQVEEASALSVAVRWVPIKTAVNGTLVAWPPRMTRYSVAPMVPPWSQGEARPR